MAGKPFFPGLVKYMSSGPVVPMVSEHFSGITLNRTIPISKPGICMHLIRELSSEQHTMWSFGYQFNLICGSCKQCLWSFGYQFTLICGSCEPSLWFFGFVTKVT
uniref:Uncharacterized protein n=1 Tax=Cacopsylla melanoneura TaxID=428564 RepID=A0A8D8LYZ1_9HEMI